MLEFLHLLINVASQLYLGYRIEKQVGTVLFGLIYLISGICGNLNSAIFLPRILEIGASSAIYGMMGSYLVDIFLNWYNLKNPIYTLISFLISTIISLAIGLLPMIDNFAHIGGFLGGSFVSMIILPNKTKIIMEKYEEIPIFRSQSSKIIRMFIGMTLLLTYILGTLYILYSNLDINQVCNWCENLNCIPIFDDWCKPIHPNATTVK